MNPPKILLLEPDMQLGAIYRQALKRNGYNVAWLHDAQSAIKKADTFAPDVIILELQLARHNGIEFLYEFRSYPDWQDVPIILHTNVVGMSFSQDLLKRLGVDIVLYKPYTTLAQLLQRVEQLLVTKVA